MRKAPLALLALVAVVACKRAAAPGPVDAARAAPTEADYAAALVAALHAVGDPRALRYDAARSAIVADGGGVIAVGNLYREWLAVPPASRDDAVARVAHSFAATRLDAPRPSLASVRGSLLPAVRDGLFFDASLLDLPVDAGAKDARLPSRPLAGALVVAVALDHADSIEFVGAPHLEDWKVRLDDLVPVATANLRARSVAPFERLAPGVWASRFHDNYDASRLLLVDEIRGLGLCGGAVALVPNRDTLLLAGAADAPALLDMAARAEKAYAAPRSIDTIPLCLDAHGWRECVPAPTDEVRRRYHQLARDGWVSLYEEQKPALQKRLGDDVFVATLSPVEDKATHERTDYATWSETVPTLLPRAERVGFAAVGKDGQPKILGLAPWDRVVAVCGKHMTPQGLSPERWATGDYFPTKDELAQLGLAMDFFPAR